MAASWKLCVIILSLVSVVLLLLVMKLIFDKGTRDKTKAEATEYLENVESSLEIEFLNDSESNWKRHLEERERQSSDDLVVAKFKESQDREERQEFLTQLKVNVTQRLPAWKTLNSTSVLGQKIRTILNLPILLLPKSKQKELNSFVAGIRKVQDEERFKMILKHKQSPIVYPLPKFMTQCHGGKMLSQSEWASYYDSVGRRVNISEYSDYIKLLTEEAGLNKFPGPTDLSIRPTFDLSAAEMVKVLKSIWMQLEPLYLEFHAYLRGELRFLWPIEGISKSGTLPAHMVEFSTGLGSACSVLYEATKPYPTNSDRDLTHILQRKRYTPRAMATFGDDFLSSIGFRVLPQSFWAESILKKPATAQNFNCKARLFQLANKQEFRISLCGHSDEDTLGTINRLLVQGTLDVNILRNQSYLLRSYANLPIRAGIEAGLLLGMRDGPYLRRLGIIEEYYEDTPSILNGLYRELFELFPQISRSLVYYHWTWDAFRLKLKPAEYSSHYWNLRLKYEGIHPKDRFDSTTTFDPAAHPDIVQTAAQNVMPLFQALIKYATFESLCRQDEVTGLGQWVGDFGRNNSNLQDCDLFGRSAVGERVTSVLKSATLLPPAKSFEIIFGSFNSSYLNASAMLNYFQPLFTYFKETNKRRELPVGW